MKEMKHLAYDTYYSANFLLIMWAKISQSISEAMYAIPKTKPNSIEKKFRFFIL